jgi:hypothetical protein
VEDFVMSKNKYYGKVTAIQSMVINDMLDPNMTEEAVLRKHNVSEKRYRKWMFMRNFRKEFEYRLMCSRRMSIMMLNKYTPVATAKLVELTQDENGETARKACMEIVGISEDIGKQGEIKEEEEPKMNYELARRIWQVMAEERKKKN